MDSIKSHIYWKEIQGRKILFADYSCVQGEELFSVMKEHVREAVEFSNKTNELLLTISIFKGNPSPDHYGLRAYQITMPSSNLNKISVVTGITNFQKILLKVVNLNKTTPLIVCETVEEGIEYLLENSKAQQKELVI